MADQRLIDLGDVALACTVEGEGPLVIAAHGFPDDASTFRAQVPALVRAGYRVVTPTMRGYAPSGLARSGQYDIVALGRDLIALADRLSPAAQVRIIGHDWGALAGFAAAALEPERVSHLAALAVPHPRRLLRGLLSLAQMRRSWYVGMFQLPRVAEARLLADDLALVDRLWMRWSPGYRATSGELDVIKEGIRHRVGAVLAYYRALPGALLGPHRRRILAPTRVPTLRLHGIDDGCIGVEVGYGEERLYERRFEAYQISGAGHFLQRERPEEVNAALLSFLER